MFNKSRSFMNMSAKIGPDKTNCLPFRMNLLLFGKPWFPLPDSVILTYSLVRVVAVVLLAPEPTTVTAVTLLIVFGELPGKDPASSIFVAVSL